MWSSGPSATAGPDGLRPLLDYVELALESGQPAEAVARTEELLARPDVASDATVRARFLRARALEAAGRTTEAIAALEGLVEDDVAVTTRLRSGVALSRAYRESGDLARAIEVGERLGPLLEAPDADAGEVAVQLAVTVAAAVFERGDADDALARCRTAMARADALGSATARASACWNASAIHAQLGEYAAAVPLAERALALLGEGADARNVARLRAEVGRLHLELDPPAVDVARQHLEQAAEAMTWSSAAPVDLAWVHLGLARARFLDGDLVGTRQLTTTVLFDSEGRAPLAEAEAKVLQGRTYAAEGDSARAAVVYQQAVDLLAGAGADQGAARLLAELADLLHLAGRADVADDVRQLVGA